MVKRDIGEVFDAVMSSDLVRRDDGESILKIIREANELIRKRPEKDSVDSTPSPRLKAVMTLVTAIAKAGQTEAVRADEELGELCALLIMCLLAVPRSNRHAALAFIKLVASSDRSVVNRDMANSRHGFNKILYHAAWQALQRGEYDSVTACAKAFADRHKGDGEPKQRAYQDYISKRAKAEGVELKRGRKRERQPDATK